MILEYWRDGLNPSTPILHYSNNPIKLPQPADD